MPAGVHTGANYIDSLIIELLRAIPCPDRCSDAARWERNHRPLPEDLDRRQSVRGYRVRCVTTAGLEVVMIEPVGSRSASEVEFPIMGKDDICSDSGVIRIAYCP